VCDRQKKCLIGCKNEMLMKDKMKKLMQGSVVLSQLEKPKRPKRKEKMQMQEGGIVIMQKFEKMNPPHIIQKKKKRKKETQKGKEYLVFLCPTANRIEHGSLEFWFKGEEVRRGVERGRA